MRFFSKFFIFNNEHGDIVESYWKHQQNVVQIVCFVPLMVFNAAYSNISVISLRSVLLLEETGGPGEKHRPIGRDTTS